MIGAAFLVLMAVAQQAPVTLLNGTQGDIAELNIRSAERPEPWRSLSPGRLSKGARAALPPRPGEDCAFDIRGTLDGQALVWPNVNLCDARLVTLNRRSDGVIWIEYE